MSKKSTGDEDEDIIFQQYKVFLFFLPRSFSYLLHPQVILLGDGAVGKTSIANRFTEDKFAQSYKQTVGVDFFVRRLQLSREFLIS
jgi:GTP-binding protein EngB required for normal cell division